MQKTKQIRAEDAISKPVKTLQNLVKRITSKQHKQSQEKQDRAHARGGWDATTEVRAFLLTLMIDFSPPVQCDWRHHSWSSKQGVGEGGRWNSYILLALHFHSENF